LEVSAISVRGLGRISRRDFIKLGGAAAAGLVLPVCGRRRECALPDPGFLKVCNDQVVNSHGEPVMLRGLKRAISQKWWVGA
jgi:hypothetical protein